jgi:hypothetical protein
MGLSSGHIREVTKSSGGLRLGRSFLSSGEKQVWTSLGIPTKNSFVGGFVNLRRDSVEVSL